MSAEPGFGGGFDPSPEGYRRRLAFQLMQSATDTSPKGHWLQGAAQLAQALVGGNMMAQDREDQAAKDKEYSTALLGLPGLGSPAQPQQPAFSAPSSAPSSNGGGSAPMTPLPKRVYNQDEMNPLDAAVATPTELAAGVPAPAKYAHLIGKAAIDNDIPAAVLAKQTKQESGFNPNVVSSAGAQGISQFMPGTAKEMGVNNPFDPNEAIPAQGRYLRQQIDRFGGSLPLGLAAYNAGPGRVAGVGGDISRLPAETQNYVKAIGGGNPQVASADPNFVPGQPAPVAANPAAPPQQMAQAPQQPGQPQAAQRQTLSIPPDVLQAIKTNLASRDPRVQAIGRALYDKYATPKDQWADERGQDGSFYQRNLTTNERKVIEKSDVLPDEAVKQKIEIAKGGKPETTINNTVNPILKGVGERFNENMDTARSSVQQIQGIHEARKALDEGAKTGAFADEKLFGAKVANMFGLGSDAAANTEVLRSAIGNTVLAKAKTLGANPSNTDRDYIEKVVGGSIKLEETSIRRLLDMQERWGRDAIKRANDDGESLLAAQPKELQPVAGLMKVREPATYDEFLKANPIITAPAAPPAAAGPDGWITAPNGARIRERR